MSTTLAINIPADPAPTGFAVINTATGNPTTNRKGCVRTWKTRRGAEQCLARILKAWPEMDGCYTVGQL